MRNKDVDDDLWRNSSSQVSGICDLRLRGGSLQLNPRFIPLWCVTFLMCQVHTGGVHTGARDMPQASTLISEL